MNDRHKEAATEDNSIYKKKLNYLNLDQDLRIIFKKAITLAYMAMV